MQKNELGQILLEMRQKYIDQESTDQETALIHRNCSPKMAKIKQKLLALEMERCQLKIDHEDSQTIDQKISDLKKRYKACQNSQI